MSAPESKSSEVEKSEVTRIMIDPSDSNYTIYIAARIMPDIRPTQLPSPLVRSCTLSNPMDGRSSRTVSNSPTVKIERVFVRIAPVESLYLSRFDVQKSFS